MLTECFYIIYITFTQLSYQIIIRIINELMYYKTVLDRFIRCYVVTRYIQEFNDMLRFMDLWKVYPLMEE